MEQFTLEVFQKSADPICRDRRLICFFLNNEEELADKINEVLEDIKVNYNNNINGDIYFGTGRVCVLRDSIRSKYFN